MVPFPVTLSDPEVRFQGQCYYSLDALDVLCAQLTRDLFAIAKFLFVFLVDPRLEQKLSYRKQIARQLRKQYVEGIYRPK